MNLVKAVVLVVVGAILGFSFSLIGKVKNEETIETNKVITPEAYLPNTTSASRIPPVINMQKAVVKNDLVLIHNQTKNRVKEDKMINQDHFDLTNRNSDLIEKNIILNNKYYKLKRKTNLLEQQLNELDGSKATNDEMEAFAPEPFKSYLSSFRGKTRNDIFDFHNKEDDLDWGYDIKNSISDFVLTHYDGTGIELISVICKQPYCEILVIEKEEDAWKNIMKDMTLQSWWKFSSTTSSSNNLSIYIFLSQ
jgi:hypothetical protein